MPAGDPLNGQGTPAASAPGGATTGNGAAQNEHKPIPFIKPARYVDLLEAFLGLLAWTAGAAALVVTAIGSTVVGGFVVAGDAVPLAATAGAAAVLLASLWANRERFDGEDQFGWLHPLHFLSVFWWASFIKHLLRVLAPATGIEAVRMFEFKVLTLAVCALIIGVPGWRTWTSVHAPTWPEVGPYAQEQLRNLTATEDQGPIAPNVIWESCSPGPFGPTRVDGTGISQRWLEARTLAVGIDPVVVGSDVHVRNGVPYAEVRFDGGLFALTMLYEGDWYPCGDIVELAQPPQMQPIDAS